MLVGGGHAHVEVLRRLARQPLDGVRASAVLDRPESVYSGMVPGLAAGDYAPAELTLDVAALARRAGARVIAARALRVEPRARRIELEGDATLAYDAASLDVGSEVAGLELPGVREHALATRPIAAFVAELEPRLAAVQAAGGARTPRIAVVGAGAAGVELAFALRARAEVCLLGEQAEILPGYARRVRARVCAEALARGIEIHTPARVCGLTRAAVLLEGGGSVPADVAVWATGAAPPALVRVSALPRDARGFVRVRATLEVEDCPGLFAAGDCAALAGEPWVPKAGVYAVRQGPVLDANLRAFLAGRTLRAWRPQRAFLSLLNLGDGRALGTKWGLSVSGRAVWWLKDRIDRGFVQRYRA